LARQSITLATPNDEWLKNQVANEEFASKSEAVNYLIKQTREQQAYDEYVQMKIDRGLKSGISTKTKDELYLEIKKRLNVQI
jgi:antitoxin ParD1/3/4